MLPDVELGFEPFRCMRIKRSGIGLVGQHREARPKDVDAAVRVLALGSVSRRDPGRLTTALRAGPPYERPTRGNASFARLHEFPLTQGNVMAVWADEPAHSYLPAPRGLHGSTFDREIVSAVRASIATSVHASLSLDTSLSKQTQDLYRCY
jgi:hypothetical protein